MMKDFSVDDSLELRRLQNWVDSVVEIARGDIEEAETVVEEDLPDLEIIGEGEWLESMAVGEVVRRDMEHADFVAEGEEDTFDLEIFDEGELVCGNQNDKNSDPSEAKSSERDDANQWPYSENRWTYSETKGWERDDRYGWTSSLGGSARKVLEVGDRRDGDGDDLEGKSSSAIVEWGKNWDDYSDSETELMDDDLIEVLVPALENGNVIIDLTVENGAYDDISDTGGEPKILEVIDLTVDGGSNEGKDIDSGIEESDHEMPNTEEESTESTSVWGDEASAEDVEEIERMLFHGWGIYGHQNCKLEIGDSLLEGAGRGVFVKQGCVIYHGQCITEYSGQVIHTTRNLNVEEQLRTIQVGRVTVLGATNLLVGNGFGSIVNSSVFGRTQSFARFVTYNNAVYMMAHIEKQQYPLRGSMELYLTAGHAWWSLFNSLHT